MPACDEVVERLLRKHPGASTAALAEGRDATLKARLSDGGGAPVAQVAGGGGRREDSGRTGMGGARRAIWQLRFESLDSRSQGRGLLRNLSPNEVFERRREGG